MTPRPLDILILSNGPGEVTTWVKPVVQELRRQLGDERAQTRISVILSPCPNAMGNEAGIALGFPEVDRVQAAEHFNRFLIWGKTAENWDWHPQGVVLFLGGDQLFPVIIGKRLGYKIVIYAEWAARWARWVDAFGAMNAQVREAIAPANQHKCQIVGDLMRDLSQQAEAENDQNCDQEIVGILPGSKKLKLTQGVPYGVAIADLIQTARPQTQVAMLVAPTLTLDTLASYADPQMSAIAAQIPQSRVTLVQPETNPPHLLTRTGHKIWLWTDYPHHHNLRKCQICLTTIGASTAELGALGIPMIVAIPVMQIDAMRAWDGLPGLLANFPLLGTPFAKAFNTVMYQIYQRKRTLWAWPNIWADGEEIVPELVGDFTPQDYAAVLLDYLAQPEKLAQMRGALQRVRGETGAAKRLVELVVNVSSRELR
ncbi:MAG: lipid-A-disaccharide synthase [Cyanobacteria bacterium P01_G01_bin.54]